MARWPDRRLIAAFLRAIACGCLFFPVSLISCHRSAEPPVVALITPLTTSDMWKGMHAGVYRSCLEQGCVRYWNAPTHEHDIDRQISLINQERNRHVAGIILGPNDASALIPSIADARQSGIPLIIVENDLSMSIIPGIPTIVSDNVAAGQIGAQRIGEALHGHGTVAVVGLDPADTPTVLRESGFVASIRKAFPEIKLLPQQFDMMSANHFDDLDPEELSTQIQAVDAIFSLDTYGTRQALAAFGPNKERSVPYIVACDEDSDLLDAVRAGRIQALIVQNTYQMGYLAAQDLMLFHNKKVVPQSVVLEPFIVDSSNIDSTAARNLLKPYAGFDR